MKKFLLSAFAAVLAMSVAAAPSFLTMPQEKDLGAPVKIENAKKAPAALQAKMIEKWAAKIKATPNFPVSTVDDLVGGYDWVYRQYTGGLTTQPDTITNTGTFERDTEDNIELVGINKIDDNTIRLTNLFIYPVNATMGTSGNYTTFTVDEDQVVYYHSTYGACSFVGVWYYEGDDTYEAGWYYGDVMGFIVDQGIIFDQDVQFYMIIQSGTYANYRLGWITEAGSYMVPDTDYNGIMTYDYTPNSNVSSYTFDYPVAVSENDNYVVTVESFGGVADNPITLNLAADSTWAADENQVLFTNSNNNYVLYGIDDEGIFGLTGTGTETTLTFDTDWTGYDADTQYWIGQRGVATITRLDDAVFVYPSNEAMYLLGTWNNWDESTPLVKGEDGKWTCTQAMDANAEFKFMDESGNWYGGTDENEVGYFEVLEGMVTDGTEIALVDGSNFRIPVAGTWTFTVDRENKTMVVSGEWVNPEPEYDHVYILGEVNGNSWNPSVAPEMATEDGITYTAEVTCSANNDGYSYFSFTTKLGADADDWSSIANYRMGAESNNFEVTNALMGTELTIQAGENAFKIADGSYTFNLNLDNMKLIITKNGGEEPVIGDVTGDGNVDIADVNAAINIILGKATVDDYPGNANIAGTDDTIDIADVNAIINIILNNN